MSSSGFSVSFSTYFELFYICGLRDAFFVGQLLFFSLFKLLFVFIDSLSLDISAYQFVYLSPFSFFFIPGEAM